jgi:outer membrane receptor for ferric coprogen and ferric-rhodotorulic acid
LFDEASSLKHSGKSDMTSRHPKIELAVKAALVAAQGLAIVHAQEAPQGPPQDNAAAPAAAEADVYVYGKAETYRPDDQTTATGLRLKTIDTPQSISVISEEMLTAIDAKTAYDAVDMVPGAQQGGRGYGNEILLLRGEQTQTPRINGMTTAAFSMLDSYLTERLEVVRGPATVLYGVTGAFGGELNQILKKPQTDFHAELGIIAGSFEEMRYRGDITGSVPGTDGRLKLRAAGQYWDYQHPQRIVNERTSTEKSGMAGLTYDFTPATTASLYAAVHRRDVDPNDGCPISLNANNRLYIQDIPLEHWYCGEGQQADYYGKYQAVYGSLSHVFENDWHMELIAASAKTTRDYHYIFGFGPAGEFGLADDEVYVYQYDEIIEPDFTSANLTLGGDFELGGRTHQFFAALEAQRQERTRNGFTSNGLGTLRLQDGGLGILADGSPIPVTDRSDRVNVVNDDTDAREYRLSLQVLINPIDRLELLVGALTQNTDIDTIRDFVDPATADRPAQIDQTDTVGRFGVTYDLTDGIGALSDARAYFSWSEGFRPNVGVFDVDGVPLTDPQEMESYEVGLKTEWIDGNVGATLAVYEAERTNVPSTAFSTIGTGGVFSQTLQGKREYAGVELEVVGEILPGWNMAFAYAYTDTEIISPLFDERLAIASVPRNQAALYTSYEFLGGPLEGLVVGGSVVRKIDYALVANADTMFQNDYDPNNQLLQSYTEVDLRVSYRGFRGALEGLEIFGSVSNATDEVYYYALTGGHPGFSNQVGPPRTYSFGLTYSFGDY